MRFVVLFVVLAVASCTALCGCGGLLHTAFGMLVEGKRWLTTTGWLNLGVFGGVMAMAAILLVLGAIHFQNAVPEESEES